MPDDPKKWQPESARIHTIAKVIQAHRRERGRFNNTDYLHKCIGCGWVGWEHDMHLAEEIEKVL